MRDAVLGYKKHHGSNPEHIVIHRDGFMDEDLTLALALLDDLEISYDIVEIRKLPQTRILAEGDYNSRYRPRASLCAIRTNRRQHSLRSVHPKVWRRATTAAFPDRFKLNG